MGGLGLKLSFGGVGTIYLGGSTPLGGQTDNWGGLTTFFKTARHLRATHYALQYDTYAICVIQKYFKKIILIFFLNYLPILRQGGLGEIFQVKICLRRLVFEIFPKNKKSDHFVC